MAKLRSRKGGMIAFWCPGCEQMHGVTVEGENYRWDWNGDADRPTISPSVLVQSGHYAPGHDGPCWCSYNEEHPDDPYTFKCMRCHSFVEDGKIRFLNDSTHALAGQTVELPDLED